ncbi:MAG: M20/M25/M40 family metallo-hydrolase [Anaerolineales bacterium]|nr:M20/M25/M40 family metallo-hydrolase [Anaerolineales bacterium]
MPPRKASNTRLPARRTAARAAKSGPALAPLDLDLVRELSNAAGVSGDEGAVRRLILEAIRPYAAEARVDALGNVLAVKPAARGRQAPRVLVAAHMDEVGLMIVDHDSDGALRFELVGGVNERMLLGKPVWVGPRRLPGVIGAAPVHLVSAERRRAVTRLGQMRIDIGAGSQEAARRQVALGERATFATEFDLLDGVFRGKALDDRLGCAALVALLRGGPYPVTLHAAFTVQEEVGLRGARVAGYALAPDAALALDCTPAQDLPDSRGRENTQYNARLGHGPVVYRADRRAIADHRLVEHLAATAEANGLPYQYRQPGGGGTDAGALQQARAGVPVASVSVPARYLHGPAALARAADAEQTLRLLQLALAGWTASVLKRP